MVATFIILFREVLEISIILSIIMAATRGVAGRGKWIWTGIGGGIAGSALVALFATNIAGAMEGMGQEIFNAGVLFAAVLMIGWTVVWMQVHGRELSKKIKHVGKSVSDGSLPLYSVAVVVSLAMWREGAEIVLFMTGILSTSSESLIAISAGGAAGAASAAIIGALLYFGLITLSSKHLFTTTSALLSLLAAGMSAQAAGYLIAADKLTTLGTTWDSSALLSQNSVIGQILHAMFGYSEQPDVLQLIFYVTTLSIIYLSLTLVKKKTSCTLQTSPAH